MKLTFKLQVADIYKSQSQKARVLTERWVDDSVFCPNCGHFNIDKYPNNQVEMNNCKGGAQTRLTIAVNITKFLIFIYYAGIYR